MFPHAAYILEGCSGNPGVQHRVYLAAYEEAAYQEDEMMKTEFAMARAFAGVSTVGAVSVGLAASVGSAVSAGLRARP